MCITWSRRLFSEMICILNYYRKLMAKLFDSFFFKFSVKTKTINYVTGKSTDDQQKMHFIRGGSVEVVQIWKRIFFRLLCELMLQTCFSIHLDIQVYRYRSSTSLYWRIDKKKEQFLWPDIKQNNFMEVTNVAFSKNLILRNLSHE